MPTDFFLILALTAVAFVAGGLTVVGMMKRKYEGQHGAPQSIKQIWWRLVAYSPLCSGLLFMGFIGLLALLA